MISTSPIKISCVIGRRSGVKPTRCRGACTRRFELGADADPARKTASRRPTHLRR